MTPTSPAPTTRPFRFGVVAPHLDDTASWLDGARRIADLGVSTLLVPDVPGWQPAPAPMLATVAAVTENSVTVETVKHTQVTILMDPSTKFLNSNASASLQDLKVGDGVVIHAKKNADKKLVAAEVKWGTGSLSADKSMPMEGMGHKH